MPHRATIDHIKERVRALESKAAPLDPDATGRAALRDPVLRYSEAFLDSLPDLPGYVETDSKGEGIRALQVGEQGRPIEELLHLLSAEVDVRLSALLRAVREELEIGGETEEESP